MKDNYLTVTALTRYVKRKIDTDPHLKNVFLKGEISNFNHHSRGHMYLTIKDSKTRVQAVMFAGYNRHLKFTPENGMQVLITGEISVFEAFGQYQLYIHQMEPDGLGSLHLAYEQLKEKLSQQGYFSDSHKQEIPKYPKHICVITSPTGAAIRDIITTLKRRYPSVQITIVPAIVQGTAAAQSLTNAIEIANQSLDFDLIILGRGGGSIEDLWGFNEQKVAEEIFHSNLPIISAVGHETDQTISDYVADLRAPTPTSAAELAVPSRIELKEKIKHMQRLLNRILYHLVSTQQERLNRMRTSYAFRYLNQLIVQKEQQLDKITDELSKSLTYFLRNGQKDFTHLYNRFMRQHPKTQIKFVSKILAEHTNDLNNKFKQILTEKERYLSNIVDKLILLNPLETMQRGFAIPYTASGDIITTHQQIQINDKIQVMVTDGTIDCQVLSKKENHNV